MEADRMVIVGKDKTPKLVVDQTNAVRDAKPCKSFKAYKGIRKPKCNCQPCWDKWISAQRAKE